MGSRNLNFPTAYGTGIVLIAGKFELDAGAVIPESVLPADGYSFTVTDVGGGSAEYFITLRDKFREILAFIPSFESDSQTAILIPKTCPVGNYQGCVVIANATDGAPNDNQSGVINFLFVVRDSSTKF